jgi:hypothetical protein
MLTESSAVEFRHQCELMPELVISSPGRGNRFNRGPPPAACKQNEACMPCLLQLKEPQVCDACFFLPDKSGHYDRHAQGHSLAASTTAAADSQ